MIQLWFLYTFHPVQMWTSSKKTWKSAQEVVSLQVNCARAQSQNNRKCVTVQTHDLTYIVWTFYEVIKQFVLVRRLLFRAPALEVKCVLINAILVDPGTVLIRPSDHAVISSVQRSLKAAVPASQPTFLPKPEFCNQKSSCLVVIRSGWRWSLCTCFAEISLECMSELASTRHVLCTLCRTFS